MTSSPNFVLRRALKEDIPAVRQMIQELADSENMSDSPQLTEEDLIRDSGLDGAPELCHIYLLDLLKPGSEKTPIIIGYSICYFSYSTRQGRSYFLQDIYVKPAYRKMGAGARIFREVAAKAKEYGCKRVDFHVHSWNTARKFYEKMGAVDMTETEDTHFYRVVADQMEKLEKELEQ